MKKKTTKVTKTLKKSAAGKITKATRKGGMSKIAAPLGGAVIGAALGTAAGAVLTNRDAKNTLKGVAGTITEYAADAITEIEKNQDRLDKVTKVALHKTRKKIN